MYSENYFAQIQLKDLQKKKKIYFYPNPATN